MSKFLEKLPKITLWCLFGISVVIGVLFFVGGSSVVEINGNPWDEPVFTDLLIKWAYVLFGLAALVWVYSLIRFDQSVVVKRRGGVTILDILVISAAVFGIAYACGSAAEVPIFGYEGTDNVGFWARYTDACVLSAYIMAGAAIVSVFVSVIYSFISKKIK